MVFHRYRINRMEIYIKIYFKELVQASQNLPGRLGGWKLRQDFCYRVEADFLLPQCTKAVLAFQLYLV